MGTQQSNGRAAVLSLLLGLTACTGSLSGSPEVPQPLEGPPISLKPGDAVRISIWREPDLSGDYLVSPTGKVVFPLVGERTVVGFAPEEMEAQLTEEFRYYLENPSVQVTALRRVAILGEVRQPNLYMIDATVTLTEAIALAGGLTPLANREKIRLIRDGNVLIQSLSVDQTIGRTPIQSGDQIEVGQKGFFARNVSVISTGIAATASIVAAIILTNR